LQKLYTTVAYNRFFASQKWIIANKLADKAKQLYINDSLISSQYNLGIANGKWNHMMDQTHIGYTYWQQPLRNSMPEVKYVSTDSAEEQGVKIDLKSITAENLIPKNVVGHAFYEADGYVSIQAAHFTKAIAGNNIHWKIINGIGRDADGIYTFPVTADVKTISSNSPHLEYEIYTLDSGDVKVNAYFSPTLNFHNDDGLKYGISIDDEQPKIISINEDDNNTKTWEQWVANNIIIKTSNHIISRAGRHVVRFWRVSPAVVLQKIVLDFGGLKQSYLGPPETKN
jgi:hypothetical protein